MEKKHLILNLPDDWVNISADNPDGPPTYCKKAYDGVFQVSIPARYQGGKKPDPTPEYLRKLAVDYGLKKELGDLKDQSMGSCGIGQFGRASFYLQDQGWTHLWYLSDGWDFILATYVSKEQVSDSETTDIAVILRDMEYTEET